MQSYQIISPHFSTQDIQSLQDLISELTGQIGRKVDILHQVFNRAFADNKGDHPAQLVYKALWIQIQTIFSEHIDSEKSLQELEIKFDDLKRNLVVFVQRYFETHKDEIAANPALLKKIGILDINTYGFKAEIFYSDFSAEKKQLFPLLVDAFKALAIQKYYLQRMNPVCRLNMLTGDEKDILADQYEEKIEQSRKELYTVFNSKMLLPTENHEDSCCLKTELDEMLCAATDKAALSQIPSFRTKLNQRKKTIATVLGRYLNELLQMDEWLFLQRYVGLQEDIQNYNKKFLKIQEAIQKGIYSEEEFAESLKRWESEYERITAEIEFLTSKEALKRFNVCKQVMLERITKDVTELSNKVYDIKEESKAINLSDDQIPVLAAIEEKQKELNFVLTYVKFENEEIQLISGLLVEANQLKNSLIKSLRAGYGYLINQSVDFNVEETTLYTAIMKDMHDYVDVMIFAATRLREALIAQCKKQSWVNALWKVDAVGAVEVGLLANEVHLFFNDADKIKSLLFHDINLLQERYQKKIEYYLHESSLRILIHRVIKAYSILTNKKEECRMILQQIEQDEFNEEMTKEKKNCIGSMNKYKNTIEKMNPRTFKVECLQGTPDDLRKLYDQPQESIKKTALVEINDHLEEKPLSFWQRHRKKIMIVAAIGISLLVTGGVTAAFILAPEVIIPILVSFGSALIAKFGIGGTIGIALGAVLTVGASFFGIKCCCKRKNKLKMEKSLSLQDGQIQQNQKEDDPLLECLGQQKTNNSAVVQALCHGAMHSTSVTNDLAHQLPMRRHSDLRRSLSQPALPLSMHRSAEQGNTVLSSSLKEHSFLRARATPDFMKKESEARMCLTRLTLN